jgi:hypothetical protein
VAATVWRAVAPSARALGKPCFLEEFGAAYQGPYQHVLDPTGVGLRTGSWASLVGGAAGAAMQWYWAEMDSLHTYGQLAGAAAVSRALATPLLALAWAPWPGTFSAPTALAGWGVGSDRATNASAAVLAYAYARNFTQCGSKVIAAPTAASALTLSGLRAHTVTTTVFYNTTTGTPLPLAAGGSATLVGGALVIVFPDFLEDAAAYITMS